MTITDIIHQTMQALVLVLMLSLPPIIVVAITGVIVSLFQALTQVQEQTLSFSIKLIAIAITIALTARWLGIELYNYALNIMIMLPTIR